MSGRLEIVELLHDHGENIETLDSTGATAIFYASKIRHGQMVQLLLDRGGILTFA